MNDIKFANFGWINQLNHPWEIGEVEAQDLLNIRLTEEWIRKRWWTAIKQNFWWTFLIQNLEDEFLWSISWWKLYKYDWVNFLLTNISWLTSNKWSIIKCFWIWTSAWITWIITWVQDFAISDTSKNFTQNDKIWKYLKITSWAWVWQVRELNLNSDKDLFVSDIWKIRPAIWDSYEIFNKAKYYVFTNWSNTPKKSLDWITWQDLNIWIFFNLIEYKNRIIWFKTWDSKLYISTLNCVDDFSWEEYTDTSTPITQIISFSDQIIIFKKKEIKICSWSVSPYNDFSIINRADYMWCIAPYSVWIGNNFLFFISHRGVDYFNPFEKNPLEYNQSLSDLKFAKGKIHPNIEDIWFCNIDWTYYYYSKIQNKTYIFDTRAYIERMSNYWRYKRQIFLVDSWYSVNWFASYKDDLYSIDDNKFLIHNQDIQFDYFYSWAWNKYNSYFKTKRFHSDWKRDIILRDCSWFISNWEWTLDILTESEFEKKTFTIKMFWNFLKYDWRARGKYLEFTLWLDNIWKTTIEQINFWIEWTTHTSKKW